MLADHVYFTLHATHPCGEQCNRPNATGNKYSVPNITAIRLRRLWVGYCRHVEKVYMVPGDGKSFAETRVMDIKIPSCPCLPFFEVLLDIFSTEFHEQDHQVIHTHYCLFAYIILEGRVLVEYSMCMFFYAWNCRSTLSDRRAQGRASRTRVHSENLC